MTSELLSALLRINLAAAAAIGLVLIMRKPWRSTFGAQAAYVLWALPPLAATAVLLPARIVHVTLKLGPVVHPARAVMSSAAQAADSSPLLLGLWLAGAALSLAVLAGRQQRLMARLGVLTAAGDQPVYRATGKAAEPAVVGVIRPRIIIPSDFEQRFDAGQRAAILAHERSHLAHFDAQANGILALVQCLAWFNPMIHFAARYMREDQELACDARVLARAAAHERRAYGEALLNTQLNAPALPLGCHWPANGVNSLKERLVMLKKPAPTLARRGLGLSLACGSALAVSAAAWAAQPPQRVFDDAQLNNPARIAEVRDYARDFLRTQLAQTTDPAQRKALVDRIAVIDQNELDQTAVQSTWTPVPVKLAQASKPASGNAPQVSVSNSVVRDMPAPAPAAPVPPPIVTDPSWQSVPSGKDLAKLYPPDAEKSEQTGQATLSCGVKDDGTLASCAVISETPTGFGFGDAALAMTDKFKMNPAVVAPGSTVNIPIKFALTP